MSPCATFNVLRAYGSHTTHDILPQYQVNITK